MSYQHRILTATTAAWLLGWGLLCLPAAGRDVKLELHPQKASVDTGKFSLLPPESAMVDGDAVPLYEKAIKALPDKAGDDQIQKWLDMPVEQLPLDAVEQGLTPYMESLRFAAKAVKCRQCAWPQATSDLSAYRRLAFAIRLWARLEIASDGYEGAVLALRTGFGMGRHLERAPTILHTMVGIAIDAVMCREIEQLVQRKDAPNLYAAISELPRALPQMERAIAAERGIAGPQDAGEERCRVIAKRFDRDLAILQCVEAIRSYAAGHNGRLPAALADIKEVPVPADPLHDGPFQYSLSGSTAVLDSAPSAGGSDKERTRYEISVKN